MTAVADVQARTVHATVEIAAAPEAVFRALTDPDELARWWGSPELYETHDWKLDLRPGGKWSCQARSPEGPGQVRGEVLAVDSTPAPRVHLGAELGGVQEEHRPLHAGEGARGTRLSLFHRGLRSEESTHGHAEGWTRVLGWLVGRLARARAVQSSA